MRPRSRLCAWLCWCSIVFGLWNSCAGHREAWSTGTLLSSGHYPRTLATGLRALRALGTDDGDLQRYLAYANAALGRPYQRFYVRPLDGWTIDARILDDGRDPNDPRVTPPLTPRAPLVPYRDFLVEYPPGFFPFAIAPALLPPARGVEGYPIAFALSMGLCLTGALWLVAWASRALAIAREPRLFGLSALSALLLGAIAVRRYDAVVSLSLSLVFAGCVRAGPMDGPPHGQANGPPGGVAGGVMAGVGFGLGVVAKGLPLVVGPLALVHLLAWRRRRAALVAALAALAVGLAALVPAWALAGPRLLDALAYHGHRPLQIESTFGALLVLSRPAFTAGPALARLSQTYGSANVVASWDPPLVALAGLLPFAAIAGVYAVTWLRVTRARGEGDSAIALLAGMVASLVAYMTLGKVASPQYLTWLLPLGVLAALADGRRATLGLLFGALGLTQVLYPLCYRLGLPDALSPVFGALVLARNVLLLAFAVRVLAPRRRTEVGSAAAE